MQQGIAHTVVVHIVSDVVGGGLGLGGRIAHRDPDAGVGEHIRVIAPSPKAMVCSRVMP